MSTDTTQPMGPTDVRPPSSAADLRYWLANMVCDHGYAADEVASATGLAPAVIEGALRRYGLAAALSARAPAEVLRVRPYPGGRHPRLGFFDGAVTPQRETKFSVFAPWAERDYAVVDLPEAIWWQDGLLYLAHEHAAAPPTPWRRQGLRLPPLEWARGAGDRLSSRRVLPNGVVFGAEVSPADRTVHMRLWLENGSAASLRDLRVQICVMLGRLPAFAAQTGDNKLFRPPFAACRDSTGRRWLITAWEACQRAWGNERCPCLHSDPQFPDCAPGERRQLRGWLAFYEGGDIEAELERLRQAWLEPGTGADAARATP